MSCHLLHLSRYHSVIVVGLEDHYPTWQEFFADLSAKVRNQVIQHTSVLHEVVGKLGGVIQPTANRAACAIIHEADLVPPLIVRGITELTTVAERQQLIALRAENENVNRLLGMFLIYCLDFRIIDNTCTRPK